jgi:hypothetical protein
VSDDVHTPPNYLSLSELARRLNLPQPRASAALRRGLWRPDATQGANNLFRDTPERLEELRAAERAGRNV